MAIEQFIKEGDKLCEAKDFNGAITYYTKAIDDSPRAFAAYWKRASAHQKAKNYKQAKEDLSMALTIANDRGSRDQIGFCHYRQGLLNYVEKDLHQALSNFVKAIELNCNEPSLPIWKLKCEKELGRDKSEGESEGATESDLKKTSTLDQAVAQSIPTTGQSPHETCSSPIPKIKDDWYQMAHSVFIAIYAKNVPKDKVKVEFSPLSVHLTFPTGSGSEYVYCADPLFASIDLTKSKYTVYALKIEVELVKSHEGTWDSLYGQDTTAAINASNTVHQYPSSSKRSTNWNSITLQEEEDGQSEDPEDFFNKLYKDVDDDARRAIKKSYVESNGTVLTTNWDEASKKTFETSPPQGMTERKWGT